MEIDKSFCPSTTAEGEIWYTIPSLLPDLTSAFFAVVLNVVTEGREIPNNSLSVFSSNVLFKSFILAVSIISLKFISSNIYSNSAAFSGELTTA